MLLCLFVVTWAIGCPLCVRKISRTAAVEGFDSLEKKMTRTNAAQSTSILDEMEHVSDLSSLSPQSNAVVVNNNMYGRIPYSYSRGLDHLPSDEVHSDLSSNSNKKLVGNVSYGKEYIYTPEASSSFRVGETYPINTQREIVPIITDASHGYGANWTRIAPSSHRL